LAFVLHPVFRLFVQAWLSSRDDEHRSEVQPASAPKTFLQLSVLPASDPKLLWKRPARMTMPFFARLPVWLLSAVPVSGQASELLWLSVV
jgi:hypothetical protein